MHKLPSKYDSETQMDLIDQSDAALAIVLYYFVSNSFKYQFLMFPYGSNLIWCDFSS